MAIDATTAAAATGAKTQSAAAVASDKLDVDYQSFLKLLTAQISNQDPLKPMDSTQFVSQLAQLSQVEQSVQTNSNLETIAAKLSSVGAMADVQLIGHEVTVPTDALPLRGGSASYSYELSDSAASAKAVIRGADGTVVREIEGLATAGGKRHDLSWDGLDSSGLRVPDDDFTVEIVARDAEGKSISYDGYGSATVKSLVFREGESRLLLDDGTEVASASVMAVE